MSADWIGGIGTVAGVVLPLFNIPLIIKIWRRKSAADFSLSWAIGVWVCIVLMTPQALRSSDVAFRSFGAVNLVFFTMVVILILKFKSAPGPSGRPERVNEEVR
ncbi:MAG: hypothetical protein MOGMAGMI_02284 [Candidatus Omnitrophica bacterium]|nr:hypothetical protein [Candidatus Omnitrophota bacterium]